MAFLKYMTYGRLLIGTNLTSNPSSSKTVSRKCLDNFSRATHGLIGHSFLLSDGAIGQGLMALDFRFLDSL